jgi:bifunctional UDP-N-acetylglucosamine pyrophosphorylase/glucosamine-1-phosphate N-acetyltransferase
MCGGRGSRFAAQGRHKSMTMVAGEPLLGHVVDYWRAFTDNFVFVVKNGRESVVDFASGLPIRAQFVEPDRLAGIADGLAHVEPHVDGPFIVVLGDCFCAGRFDAVAPFRYGIGVQRNARPEHIRRNYAVSVDGGRVTGVQEKPQDLVNDLCGMGFYFLQPDVFRHIRATRASERTGELEITDVVQTIVDAGEDLRALMFDGCYVNANSPEHLAEIELALESRNAAAG